MDVLKLNFKIVKEDFSKAGKASSDIKKSLKKLGIPSKIIRRVAIITYEAEMNIVIHSFGGEIIVNIDEEKIEIIAKDNGPGIKDVDKALEIGFSTANNEVRELGFGAGMGLPNIKRSSDTFNIKSKYNEYTILTCIIYHEK